jgi:mannose-6-phosphate isomerase-like protein (cupin superfamily)
MVLRPGQSTGPPDNEHPKSEQWLFVIGGTGRAVIDGRRIGIRKNSLLLIAKGEKHQIVNAGRRPLITINFYLPPAYSPNGEPKHR